MMFTQEQLAQLSAPLDLAKVKRNPKGHDYIEGWHVIAEANRIFGFGMWDRETVEMAQVGPSYETNGNHRVGYRARVRITVTTPASDIIIRDGTGYGSGIGKDLNDCHEGASKEAETDAMKRAMMTFGNAFGLALYDKERTNVAAIASEDWASFAVEFAEVLDRCETEDAISRLWKARTERLNLMKVEAAPIYAATLNAAKARKATLNPQQKAA